LLIVRRTVHSQLLKKFVHAADLHIDSPMKGLAAYPGAITAPKLQAARQLREAKRSHDAGRSMSAGPALCRALAKTPR
jgi:hypothetical protein